MEDINKNIVNTAVKEAVKGTGLEDVVFMDIADFMGLHTAVTEVMLKSTGKAIYVKELSGADLLNIQDHGEDVKAINATLLHKALCDKNGKALGSKEQIKVMVANLPANVYLELVQVCGEASGITPKADVEDIAKN